LERNPRRVDELRRVLGAGDAGVGQRSTTLSWNRCFDRQLLFRVGAMPLELTSIIAGFGFGRPGQVVLQIVAVAAYCLAAIGSLALRERDEISCDCSRNSGIAPAGVVSQLRNTFRDATGISPLCDYLVVRFSLRVRPNVGLFAATR
jgi:hypothetical protein